MSSSIFFNSLLPWLATQKPQAAAQTSAVESSSAKVTEVAVSKLDKPMFNFNYETQYIAFAKEHRIEEMDFEGFPLVDVSLQKLTELTWLKKLTIRNGEFTDAGVLALGSLTDLETLELNWCWNITDGALQVLKEMPKLKILSLMGCPLITGKGLSHLSSDSIENINIGWCQQVTDECFYALKPVNSLRVLNLAESSISKPTLIRLQEFPSLEVLSLCGCVNLWGDPRSGEQLFALSHLKTLKDLDLGCIMTPDALPVLSELPNLHTLRLINCVILPFTDETLAYLKSLKSLENLYASNKYANTAYHGIRMYIDTLLTFESAEDWRRQLVFPVSYLLSKSFEDSHKFLMDQGRIVLTS